MPPREACDSGSSLDRSSLAINTGPFIHDFEPILITRRDPALKMARLYAIALQPTLFGEVSVIRSWERIGTRGRMKLETFPSLPAAGHQVAALERQKWRRGYG